MWRAMQEAEVGWVQKGEDISDAVQIVGDTAAELATGGVAAVAR
jgi:hypothetical protein